jgi:propanol-preferring alcohol dehydrogenase
MKAMLLERPGERLRLADLPVPGPGAGQILVEVEACAVCRTDLHVVDGELPEPKLPLVPGHEIVGRVVRAGGGVDWFRKGDRVGIPWLGYTCARCRYCVAGQENLCDAARFTGYQIDGGYAEYTVADARYCFPIHGPYTDAEAAPLLCAGLIGYRSLGMAGDARHLGISASAPRRTSWPRSPGTRGGRSTPSPGRATSWRRTSRASLARSGPAARTSARPRSSTPR